MCISVSKVVRNIAQCRVFRSSYHSWSRLGTDLTLSSLVTIPQEIYIMPADHQLEDLFCCEGIVELNICRFVISSRSYVIRVSLSKLLDRPCDD